MKFHFKNSVPLYTPVLLIAILIALLFQSQFYELRSEEEVKEQYKKEIIALGEEALKSLDVPVGAILLYGDSIIGKGYNTVRDKKVLSGHAEINALNMAYENYGASFAKLDRNKLALYSSFEPCEMCKGALIHYNINQVYFERRKPLLHQLKSTVKGLQYEWSKKKFDADSLQEKLFLKHPEYAK